MSQIDSFYHQSPASFDATHSQAQQQQQQHQQQAFYPGASSSSLASPSPAFPHAYPNQNLQSFQHQQYSSGPGGYPSNYNGSTPAGMSTGYQRLPGQQQQMQHLTSGK